jgi:hypothetical protein
MHCVSLTLTKRHELELHTGVEVHICARDMCEIMLGFFRAFAARMCDCRLSRRMGDELDLNQLEFGMHALLSTLDPSLHVQR